MSNHRHLGVEIHFIKGCSSCTIFICLKGPINNDQDNIVPMDHTKDTFVMRSSKTAIRQSGKILMHRSLVALQINHLRQDNVSCIALYCIALHCIALYCIALYCIALHCKMIKHVLISCTRRDYIVKLAKILLGRIANCDRSNENNFQAGVLPSIISVRSSWGNSRCLGIAMQWRGGRSLICMILS